MSKVGDLDLSPFTAFGGLVVTLPLAVQEASRPRRVMLRYGSSPFAFYRGAALVMAADLATTPHSGLRVQLCGDAHLSNFGFYASPERHLVFDLNDFDETLPGPFEWDVKRLAASVEIAVLSQSFKTKETRAIVVGAGRSYRENMRAFAMMPNQAVWYARLDADEFLAKLREVASPERLRKAETLIASARSWPGGCSDVTYSHFPKSD